MPDSFAANSGKAALRDHPTEGLLVGLTFVAGMVDAITYLGLGHVFTANMTGNLVLLGFAVVDRDNASIFAALASLAAYVLGATLGGRLAGALQARHERWLVTSLGLESGLLVAALLGAVFGASSLTLIGLVALAMGIRNTTMRRIAVPDLTTTQLTSTLTDLAADAHSHGDAPPALWRRIGALIALLVGAATSALLVRGAGVPFAIGAAVGVLALQTVGYLALRRRPRPWKTPGCTRRRAARPPWTSDRSWRGSCTTPSPRRPSPSS